MSHTSRLKRIPDTFRQLTGITPEAFDQLLGELEPRYKAVERGSVSSTRFTAVGVRSAVRDREQLPPVGRVPGGDASRDVVYRLVVG